MEDTTYNPAITRGKNNFQFTQFKITNPAQAWTAFEVQFNGNFMVVGNQVEEWQWKSEQDLKSQPSSQRASTHLDLFSNQEHDSHCRKWRIHSTFSKDLIVEYKRQCLPRRDHRPYVHHQSIRQHHSYPHQHGDSRLHFAPQR